MLDFDGHIVNLLAGLVYLRIFKLDIYDIDDEWPLWGQFIMKVSDRVPHLEYFYLRPRPYKRIGGKSVECDETEHYSSEF